MYNGQIWNMMRHITNLILIVGFVWKWATPPKLQCRIDLNRTHDRTLVMVTAKDNSTLW